MIVLDISDNAVYFYVFETPKMIKFYHKKLKSLHKYYPAATGTAFSAKLCTLR